jgi:hypothetical protein
MNTIRIAKNTRQDPPDSLSISSNSSKQQTVFRIMRRALFLLPWISVQGKRIHPRHCGGGVKHIHLAVGRDPTREMTVSFASKWSVPGAIAPVGGVHVGLAPNQLDRFVPEQEYPIQYETAIPEMDGQMYYSPFQHHISIDGLEPNTTYYYVAVDGSRENGMEGLATKSLHQENLEPDGYIMKQEEENEEEDRGRLRRKRRLEPAPYDGSHKTCLESYRVRSFTTAPERSEAPVSFAIIGDLGQFQHSQETLEHMKDHREGIDAVILVGDLAYTDFDHRRWDTFFDFLDDFSIFDEVPLHIATGNHGKELLFSHSRSRITAAIRTVLSTCPSCFRVAQISKSKKMEMRYSKHTKPDSACHKFDQPSSVSLISQESSI